MLRGALAHYLICSLDFDRPWLAQCRLDQVSKHRKTAMPLARAVNRQKAQSIDYADDQSGVLPHAVEPDSETARV